jgi:hypothetical protein
MRTTLTIDNDLAGLLKHIELPPCRMGDVVDIEQSELFDAQTGQLHGVRLVAQRSDLRPGLRRSEDVVTLFGEPESGALAETGAGYQNGSVHLSTPSSDNHNRNNWNIRPRHMARIAALDQYSTRKEKRCMLQTTW